MCQTKPINVGVVGLGGMGRRHLDAWAMQDGARIAAVADHNVERLASRHHTGAKPETSLAGGLDLAGDEVKKYQRALDLIADADVDIVDICLPTPLHLEIGLASLEAGKHTLIEKPLARTFAQAERLADAAERAWSERGVVSMAAMCMRFWPAWEWLKEAVQQQTFGVVRCVMFRRVSSFPEGRFYDDGDASGGAALDLHLHDVDFLRHLLGHRPGEPLPAVTSHGYAMRTDQPDHLHTAYRPVGSPPAGFADDALLTAEGGWVMAKGFPFTMRYTVNFQNATADFDIARTDNQLMLYQSGEASVVEVAREPGYPREIAYFLSCVRNGKPAVRCDLRDAAESVRLIEAEVAAMETPR